jgi:GT2 family glycosyltransferase
MISLVIPTVSRTREYTEALIKNIREIYPNENEVEIVVEENDNVTMGVNYNNAVAKANGKKIILLHNDMILKPGFIEIMNQDITKNRIVTYTRVEPPIYNDLYPGKIILDCGRDLNSLDKEKFYNLPLEEELQDGGSQLFLGCYKEDYIGIDGVTFKLFCEDDDFHLRCDIAGLERKISPAQVYHFVSKTSRTWDYQKVEQQSNVNFVKKWGFRNSIHNIVYKKSIKIYNSNPQLEQILEPWFNGGKDIIVEADGNSFTQQDFITIHQLNDIIKESGEIGSFELGNLKITINSMDEYQNTLIKI